MSVNLVDLVKELAVSRVFTCKTSASIQPSEDPHEYSSMYLQPSASIHPRIEPLNAWRWWCTAFFFNSVPLGTGGDGRRRRGRRCGGRFGRAGRCGGRQSCRGHGLEGRREGRERGEGRRRDEGCGLCFFSNSKSRTEVLLNFLESIFLLCLLKQHFVK